MHKFFSNRRLVIIIVCIIISLGLMTLSVEISKKKTTPPLLQQFSNDVTGFAGRIVDGPVNGVHHLFSNTHQLLNTYQENQILKKQVGNVAAVQVRNQALQGENQQLKRQLKIGNTPTDTRSINASVIDRTPSSWQDQIIINKGENDGVVKNMSVLVGSGLAGRVVEVNRSNSKIELITNSNSSSDRFPIQVTTKDGKVLNGIVTGYDRNNNEIEMGNLTSSAKLKSGAKVLTSGLGGITPKGIYVGKIVNVSSDDYGLSSKVSIKPSADMNDIQVVTVIGKNN
ncbi:cell shape-determining protein MreC [Philodulcilactobacillus myokoensis]|uniref:Cell shape-determining protein MreC n=1 Tax=Philodulcilactobacillus myokoensis TaxID=2929573 RepID=A0A9W6B1H5_9LACO|nr:rod shape-determining protein MreC [Philodulcilactobacillus myokoensis]GLB46663.1 cell shape-determining protein MreC [Philodulcilactobacillus myokoensis]